MYRILVLLGAVVSLLATSTAPTLAAPAPQAEQRTLCSQQYDSVYGEDGRTFSSRGECHRYLASGGIVSTTPPAGLSIEFVLGEWYRMHTGTAWVRDAEWVVTGIDGALTYRFFQTTVSSTYPEGNTSTIGPFSIPDDGDDTEVLSIFVPVYCSDDGSSTWISGVEVTDESGATETWTQEADPCDEAPQPPAE